MKWIRKVLIFPIIVMEEILLNYFDEFLGVIAYIGLFFIGLYFWEVIV